MKARRVEGLDPHEPLRPNAARIVRTRLDELRGFTDQALAPDASVAQHDMRIAAKRLRYVLEIVGPCIGEEALAAHRAAKELQSVLGDLHDCDLMLLKIESIESLAEHAPCPPSASIPQFRRALAGRGQQRHLDRPRSRLVRTKRTFSMPNMGNRRFVPRHRMFTACSPVVHNFSPARSEFWL